MNTLSGNDFNALYPNKEFYKILNANFKHYDFTYTHGLNVDHLPFNPTGSCSAGGLYFAELDKVCSWMYLDSIYIAKVTVPPDASVYIERSSFKADKFILDLDNKILIADWHLWADADWCKRAIDQNAYLLRFVKNKTEELYTAAVTLTPGALEYVDDQTEALCEIAVKKDGFSLKYVKNKTVNLCIHAVKQHGMVLEYAPIQTQEMCEYAINQSMHSLYYVKDQTKEICEIAFKKDGHSLRYVRDQTLEMCELAFKYNCYDAIQCVKNQTDEICKAAVKINGHTLSFVKNKTEEICELAVQQNGIALIYVPYEDQTEKICELAVQQTGLALRYVRFQTAKICEMAINQNADAIKLVRTSYDDFDDKKYSRCDYQNDDIRDYKNDIICD